MRSQSTAILWWDMARPHKEVRLHTGHGIYSCKLDLRGMGCTSRTVAYTSTTAESALTDDFCMQIWISPIVKNIEGNAAVGEPYHGFWSKDITKLNDHFGTADDLRALTKAVHDRGMLLMIDVVANNFASVGPGAATNFANFVPFNKKEYFHPFCFIEDYENP